jgi:hypothetical protein
MRSPVDEPPSFAPRMELLEDLGVVVATDRDDLGSPGRATSR